MKKVSQALTAVCCACCASAAFAGEVEVFGAVDTYLSYYGNGSDSFVQLGSGGKTGSRFGIKGSEDLGGGTSVFFVLDNGFISDNGVGTPEATKGEGFAFQREAVLGVRSDRFGSLSFGRQYTLNFLNMAIYDPFAMGLGSILGSWANPSRPSINGGLGAEGSDDATRRDNSILYTSPSFHGLTVQAMMSLGEQKNSNSKGNSYSIGLQYENGAFRGGLTWFNQSVNFGTRTQHYTYNNTFNLGMSYDFKVTKLHANAIIKQTKDKNFDNPNLQAYAVSSETPLWGGKVLAQFSYLRNSSIDDADGYGVGLRYDYPLSRRTTIYAGGAYVHNDARSNYDISGGGGSSAAPEQPYGKSPRTVFVGISHLF